MADVVIVGASIAGLATALAMGGAGHRVRVLERADAPPQGPPGEVALDWDRPTVPQAVHSHTISSSAVAVLRSRVPRLLERLTENGAELLDLLDALPPLVTDRAREVGDEELVALACRRNVLELLLYRTAQELPHVGIEHNVTVRGAEFDPAPGARIRSVTDADGRRVPADVVVDATGRRTESRSWLEAAGVPLAPDLTVPSAMTGFSRHYRLRSPGRPAPLNRGNATAGVWDHYAAALHPGDNGTFAIALMMPTGDRETASLRDPAAFGAVARATPGLGPWLEPGVSEALTPVNVIACPPNTLRGTVTDRQEPVAGLFAVGDAACVTNPLFGRGMSLALRHAFELADLIGTGRVDHATSRAAARLAERVYLPWYEAAARDDGRRSALWDASRGISPAEPAPSSGSAPSPGPAAGSGPVQLRDAMLSDAWVWRAMTRSVMGLRPPAEVFGDEKFLARVRQAPPVDPALIPSAPTREELLGILASSGGAG
ncbi:2-polyprenyl-6-methoxyphenol hydroxylase-like FAD-dependent oxidoreductase [Streptomyces sp. V3I8]|uniref:FAD-dependent oxidoreductase n=1 Tax=Streptomyces sp. V3I8 TaxID=3042279 RepID=UPI00278305C3|nr:hypothetical protein [Streptomyces sp. V3I8]MDQ1033714.1 2-polyprenyl-6-methoxyphenol hydroxylase-like FAD-dependent oxidoreductase [Streptomyces sp. V3I8]